MDQGQNPYGADPQAEGAPQSGDAYPGDATDGSQVATDDPNDAGTGDVDDVEIDSTLGQYGTWGEEEGYGRVWRPDASAVGADFMPYETCGTWVWTEYGWTYNCDWDWGWLPFHYGRWCWFDNYWGWVPGYTWGPGWVEWRGGGDYVGWRPLPAQGRGGRNLRAYDTHWRFTNKVDFGKNIRAHLRGDVAEGLRQTQPVDAPRIHGTTTTNARNVMRARMANEHNRAVGGRNVVGHAPEHPVGREQPSRDRQPIRDRERETPTWQRNRDTTNRQPVREREPAVREREPQRETTERRPVEHHTTERRPVEHHVNHSPPPSHSSGGSHVTHSSGGSSHSSGGGHSSGHSSGGHSGGGGHHR